MTHFDRAKSKNELSRRDLSAHIDDDDSKEERRELSHHITREKKREANRE